MSGNTEGTREQNGSFVLISRIVVQNKWAEPTRLQSSSYLETTLDSRKSQPQREARDPGTRTEAAAESFLSRLGGSQAAGPSEVWIKTKAKHPRASTHHRISSVSGSETFTGKSRGFKDVGAGKMAR